ncbi:hypothetical protein DBR23_03645 [Acidovorax sp. HMWF018]|nr:hypothetical protein [Burkholderiales bacterium]PTT42360.1 hypothetical protein DBR23_03645 [Acidovorax sp. HMWF018]
MGVLAVIYTSRAETPEWDGVSAPPTTGNVRVYKVFDDGSIAFHGAGTYVTRVDTPPYINNYGFTGVSNPPFSDPTITPSSSAVDRGEGDPACYLSAGDDPYEYDVYASEQDYIDLLPPLFSVTIPVDGWDGIPIVSGFRFHAALPMLATAPVEAFWTGLVGTKERL